jgi:hypothetical protein
MMDEHRNYELKVNAQQARIIIDALDLFSRVGTGQLEEIELVLRNSSPNPEVFEDRNTTDLARAALREVKTILFHFPDIASPVQGQGAHSIVSDIVPVRYRAAYDIQCVLRKAVADAEGMKNLWADPPICAATEEIPLCEAQEVFNIEVLIPRDNVGVMVNAEVHRNGAIICCESCTYSHECANHETAGDYRSEGGFSPDIQIDHPEEKTDVCQVRCYSKCSATTDHAGVGQEWLEPDNRGHTRGVAMYDWEARKLISYEEWLENLEDKIQKKEEQDDRPADYYG